MSVLCIVVTAGPVMVNVVGCLKWKHCEIKGTLKSWKLKDSEIDEHVSGVKFDAEHDKRTKSIV